MRGIRLGRVVYDTNPGHPNPGHPNPGRDGPVLEDSLRIRRVHLTEKVQETATSRGHEAAESRSCQ